MQTEAEGQLSGEPSEKKTGPKRRKERSFWKELPILIIVALGLALLIKTFLVQAFYIPSESMENTLRINDRVLVNKLSYRFGDVERGDVIVFSGADSWQSEIEIQPPANAVDGFFRKVGEVFGFAPVGEKDFIKRVIGIPGDRVECCTNGKVTVNGKVLDEESYTYPGDAPSAQEFGPLTVPKGRLWVMGDHRSASYDSRMRQGDPGQGTVPIDHVIGRAFVVVWPIPHWSGLGRPATFDQPGLAASGAFGSPGAFAGLGVALPLLGLRVWRRRTLSKQAPGGLRTPVALPPTDVFETAEASDARSRDPGPRAWRRRRSNTD